MKRVTNWCSGATSSRLVSSPEPRMLEAFTGEAQLLGGRQAAYVCTAPSSQRLRFCFHQSSRDGATQTKTLVSGTCGRSDLSQAQGTLDGRLKPEECIPCRPISMPQLLAEAANSTEGCCGNSCLLPVPSAGNLLVPGWGRNKVVPGSSLTIPCKRSDRQMVYV